MLSRNIDLQDVLARRYLCTLRLTGDKCVDVSLVGDGLDGGAAPALTKGTLHA